VQDLLSLARARNKQRSQLHGHFSATINPVILEEDSAHLPPHAFRQDMPGTLKVADGTIDRVRPFPMPMPPPYAAELDQMNSTDMEDIAGIHRSTSGRAESAQQSGIHAQVLAQGDAQRHRVGRMLFESSAGELGQHLLMLAWEFITQERTISITGDAGERDVVVFKGSDLSKRRPFGPWAFNVTAALAPIEDMAQTVAKLETLLKYQILRPENERDKQLILRWVGERVPAETDDWSYHRSQAAKENAELLAGKPINEAIGDFDAVHVAEHERFTTTEEYKRKVREELSRGDVVASAEGGESQQQAPRQSRTAFAMLTHIRAHWYNETLKRVRKAVIEQKVTMDLARDYGILMSPGGPPGPGGPAPGGPGRRAPRPPVQQGAGNGRPTRPGAGAGAGAGPVSGRV